MSIMKKMISLRKFEPKTAKAGEEVDRKKELRDKIQEKYTDLSDFCQVFKEKEKHSIYVKFHFLEGTGVEGRTKKDLDNLLKIVCDVLPDYMDNNKTEPGLGIIKTDNSIFEIHSIKETVTHEDDEGVDIEISEYVN